MTSRLLIALLAAAFVAGCNNASTTPTTPTPTVISPVTNSFTSRLPRGGAVARSFTTSAAGQISLTLKSTSPSSKIGVGLGVPFSTSGVANCQLTISVESSGGSTPQIAAQAETGTYCVVAYDLGTLAASVDFDASITYP